jgi:Ca2+-binding RTX toxin-like protein
MFGYGDGDTVIGPDVTSNWTLTGDNTISVAGVSFERVENLVGGAGTDTFIGPNQANSWNLIGSNAGQTLGMGWQGVEKLTGGNQADTFVIGPAANLSGILQGGGGVDLIDYGSYGSSVTVDLASASATGVASFASIAQFRGSTGNDTFVGANNNNSWSFAGNGGSVDGVAFEEFELWQGGSATDTLHGLDTPTIWNLSGLNGGSVYGTNFSGMENLTGGDQGDAFVVQSGSLVGTIQGGNGTDVIDYSLLTGAAAVNLETASATGVASFASIASFIGSAAIDALIGADNNNLWTITGPTAGTVDSTAFSEFESLQGGAAVDTFKVSEGVSFNGNAEGGGGIDKLDYSAYAGDVQVILVTGTATGFVNVSGIENLTGGNGNDKLVGDAAANVISGGNGNDIILGWGGDDTLNGNTGRDLLFGGSGADVIHGNNTEDILVGGNTVYADENLGTVNHAALDAIMSEWGRNDLALPAKLAYDQRVGHLSGSLAGGLNGGTFLNSSTVFDDGEIDALWGDAGLDWFLADPMDEIHSAANETVTPS